MPINKIDRHIGYKIRKERKSLKISQESLALDLEISPQQLQKYESGQNRVSASKIYEISKILNTNPNIFYEGLDGININQEPIKITDEIKDEKIKEIISNLISHLESK